MKMRSVACCLLMIGLQWACSAQPESGGAPPTPGSYLDQPQPGDTALLFAPGLVSIEGRYEYGLSFSPDGQEVIFSAEQSGTGSSLIHFVAGDSGWVGPSEVVLSDGLKAAEMEAFFTPDGERIYFAAYDEGMDVRIWAVDRTEDGWNNPRQMGSPMADDPAFYPTSTADGAIYYPNLTERRIFRASVVGDSVHGTVDTGIEAMHAFIAPDESFVLLDIREGGQEDDPDIYVAFRQPDGSWSEAVDLGPGVNTDFSETCPSLSHDGRFIFFSRYNEPNEVANIYWVSSSLIEEARGRLEDRGGTDG